MKTTVESVGHTPGPWRYSCAPEQCDVRSENDPLHTLYCTVDVGWGDKEHNAKAICEANARLIAAAPELLWALDRMISELPSRRDWLDPELEAAALAAIAKAKRTEGKS